MNKDRFADKFLASVSILGYLLQAVPQVQAQGGTQLYWECLTGVAGTGQPSWCPVSNTYPLPVAGASGTTGVSALGNAINAEPTPATNGQATQVSVDLLGRVIVSPWANKENWINNSTSSNTTALVTLLGAQAAGVKNYIHTMHCFRSDTGTTPATLQFTDINSTRVVLSAPGASATASKFEGVYEPPIYTTTAGAFSFSSSIAVTSIWCDAQGFKGT